MRQSLRRISLSVLAAIAVGIAGLAAAVADAGPTGFPSRNGTILAGGTENYKLYIVSTNRRQSPTAITGVRTAGGGGQAAWSPDGMRIAFARQGGGIFTVDAAGRHRRRISERGAKPEWSPDGSQLVFTRAGWLYVVGRDGRGLRRLFRGSDATWSPDGTRIAFRLSDRQDGLNDIFVAALDGSERLRLTAASSYECGENQGADSYGYPEWAPDGSRIAFVWWSACDSNVHSTIVAVSPDGARFWSLVEGFGVGGPFAPVWSPDGLALAYLEIYDFAGFNGLKVLPLGGTPRKVASTLIPFDWRPICGRRGGAGRDRLEGTVGPDLICGLGGADTISGGAGSDRLFGEDGSDRFLARDGEFDVIGCGAGRDTVVADEVDLAGRDCESVDRS